MQTLRLLGPVPAAAPLAPHNAVQIHLHPEGAYPTEPWVEHFEWLASLFEEQPEFRDGRMWVSDRPGLGFTLTQRMRNLATEAASIGRP